MGRLGEGDECGCVGCVGVVKKPKVVRVCDGSGELPQVCYVTRVHEHCVCGMPKAVGAGCCVWCVWDKDLSAERLSWELSGRLVGGTWQTPWNSGGRVRKERRA